MDRKKVFDKILTLIRDWNIISWKPVISWFRENDDVMEIYTSIFSHQRYFQNYSDQIWHIYIQV